MVKYVFEMEENIENCSDCPVRFLDNFERLNCGFDEYGQKGIDCSDILKPLNCPLTLVDDKGQKQADAFSWVD